MTETFKENIKNFQWQDGLVGKGTCKPENPGLWKESTNSQELPSDLHTPAVA